MLMSLSDTPNNTNLNQAQSTTLGLSQTIMKTLPRKLREQIYAHILAIGNVKITVCDGKLPYHIRSRCDRMRTHDSFWDATDLKHYVDPLCVGTQMADEIAQSYYKTNTFYFDYHELYLLEKFLTIDRFGRGLRPAHLVQSIEIVLDEQYLCPCNGNALFFHGLAATNAIAPEAVIRSCLSQLLSLTTESAKISFIVYSLDRRNRYLDPKHKLVEILSSIMSKLISQGHSTSLALYNGAGCQWSIKGSAVRPIEEVLTESMARIY
ncbi:hypothetical protein P280DRAFT_37915 [Massarina eburnea CBS 473.64]|uniref:Uncharacterized protein n=1 Tax=Massarina eburnea CBS 473.64 TaxID=1395130 RepID=A0A6A6RWE1_9PLEO|nr:hypothetical protein P280DRAFT_37915 [Massarina eburnea CBS 473.64]